MKIFAALLIFLVSPFAQAQVTNSKLEGRHQALIQKAIADQCYFYEEIFEIKTVREEIWVDQGIIDINFVTSLEYTENVDQGIFDEYEATVVSKFYSAYDHEGQDWGIYRIESVSCTRK